MKTKIVISGIICISCILLHSSSGYAHDLILLSNGGTIEQCLITSNTFTLKPVYMTNMPGGYFSGIYPSIDKHNNIYFRKTYHSKPDICCVNATNLNQSNIDTILQGLNPAINQNGTYLLYNIFSLTNETTINIFSIKEKKVVLTIKDLHKYQYKGIWLTNDYFIYCNSTMSKIICNVATGKKAIMNLPAEIIPCQLSPDKNKILCVNTEYNRLYLYNVKSKKIELLFKEESISPSFVWNPDSTGFIYSHKTDFKLRFFLSLTDLVMSGEKTSLYYRNINGQDILIQDKFSLFGGIWKEKYSQH